MIDTGDTVKHRPSGEIWLVAYVREERDEIAWCGWPPGLAKLSDCDLVEAATPEKRDKYLNELARISGNDHRRSYARHRLGLPL